MIKAAAGGGGRDIRTAHEMADVERLLPLASAEAMAALGDGGVYVEKIIEKARHIEVQILGDGKRVLHCFERECSLQRRRQKSEEAPSFILPHSTREALCRSAVALAEFVNYRGAGTIEYLDDDVQDQFYFIEMNTRIRVAHPVTEMITGIDLVREMIRIASSDELGIRQDSVRINGHAVEARINAEDPTNNLTPAPGTVNDLSVPGGPGTRFDTLLSPGYQVPPFYDSLLGKLIVWDETRDAAMARIAGALHGLILDGLKTNKALHQVLVRDEAVRRGTFHTRWFEQKAAKIQV